MRNDITKLNVVPVLACILLFFSNSYSQTDVCKKWQSFVDPKIESSETIDVRNSKLNINWLEGIECLLKMKGKKHSSNYSTITEETLGVKRPSPTVEVLALYSISSIYYQNWKHAWGIILIEDGKQNKKSTIKKAYKAYQSWFEKVKEIGLEEVRKQKLDPLTGSGVSWY